MSLLSRCVVLAAVVAACQLALVSAVCQPNFVCNTTTLDYTDCACLIDLAVPFNPSDPFSTATGCPTCPSLVGYCPMLNPRRGHVILCHREEADDFADYPTYTPSLPPSSARRARNPAQGQPMDLETYFPPANYSNFHYHMIEVPRREVSDVLRRGAFAPTPGSCCSCDIDLCNARRSTVQLIQSGTDALFAVDFSNITAKNEAFHNYVAQMEAVLTEDASSVIESIGVFSPRTVLIEYQLVVSPYGGGSALSLARKPNSLTYLGDVVEEVSCERFNLNVENYLQSGVSVYDFFRRFTFEPNSARVKLLEVTPSCILRGLSQAPTNTQITQICGALSQLCAMVPTYEFRDDINGCFQLWGRLQAKQQAMVDGQCNYQFPGTADTSQCRQVHFLSALIDPDVHCPHTNTVSAPCADKASDFPGNGCVFYTGPAPASD